jgi:4-hydroxybenzoate decarboxylase subunit C
MQTCAPSSIVCAATVISSRSTPRSRHANQEVAEIHRRVIAAGGPALLFTRVRGAAFPLVTNLFGTARRAELAFGERPLALIKRIVHLAETLLPPTPAKLWGARDLAWEVRASARAA